MKVATEAACRQLCGPEIGLAAKPRVVSLFGIPKLFHAHQVEHTSQILVVRLIFA